MSETDIMQGAGEFIGQSRAEEQVAAAWNSGRMPHAWLLTGPRGVGKATLAHRIARFVLAGPDSAASDPGLFGPSDNVPVGLDVPTDSPAARLVASGGHPDLAVIRRSTNQQTKRMRQEIVVEDVAAVSRKLALTPAMGGWRVIIIDSADEMNNNAANALLKILEEPSQRALLLLVSHAPGGLLPTIRSRCRKLHLSPLSDDQVKQLLDRLQPDLDAGARDMAADLAEGSIGRALEMVEGGGFDVLQDAVKLFGGSHPVDRRTLNEVTGKWIQRVRDETEDSLGDRLDLILWWLGRCLRRNAMGQTGAPETVSGEDGMIARFVDRFGLAGFCDRVETARQAARQGVALSLDRRQIVTSVVAALTD